MGYEAWAEELVSLQSSTADLRRDQRELPQKIQNLVDRERELNAYEQQLIERRNALAGIIDALKYDTECRSAMLGAGLQARNLLDFWYRTADQKVLNMRPEARELMIVLGSLIAVDRIRRGLVKPAAGESQQYDVHSWNYFKRLPGYQKAYQLLSDGCPASLVRNYLTRLNEDPDAAPPVPLKRDLKEAVSTDELGFRSEERAAQFIGKASAGLSMNLTKGG